MLCAPRTRLTVSAIWNRFCVVPCGTRKDDPSWMLGNVSCGPAATGTIALSNALNETVAALTNVGPTTRVHVPTIEL